MHPVPSSADPETRRPWPAVAATGAELGVSVLPNIYALSWQKKPAPDLRRSQVPSFAHILTAMLVKHCNAPEAMLAGRKRTDTERCCLNTLTAKGRHTTREASSRPSTPVLRFSPPSTCNHVPISLCMLLTGRGRRLPDCTMLSSTLARQLFGRCSVGLDSKWAGVNDGGLRWFAAVLPGSCYLAHIR